MTTDNRTNEMIVADAMVNAGAPLMHSRVEEAVVAALRTAGRLAEEPNKYAGFIARQEHQRDPWRGIGKKCLCGVVFDSDVDHAMHQVEAILEAALVAAQGAAPQAEAYDHCCNHPKCPGGSLCCCVSVQRLRDCWNQWREEIAGDSRQAFHDGYQAGQNDPAPWLAAPVLPSSGVDEDKLAKAIDKALIRHGEMIGMSNQERWDARDDIARAVATYLRGES